MRGLLIALLLISILPGCHRPTEGDVRYRGNRPGVTYVSDTDPEWQQAVQQAQRTLDQFIYALANRNPQHTGFAIKTVLQEGTRSEGVWLTSVSFDGRLFEGVINNEPLEVRRFRLGTVIKLETNRVSDWMFVDNGVLRGGNTLRLVHATLNLQDQKKFESTLPFRMQ